MDQIDRKDVVREESLQLAVRKDHYKSISTVRATYRFRRCILLTW